MRHTSRSFALALFTRENQTFAHTHTRAARARQPCVTCPGESTIRNFVRISRNLMKVKSNKWNKFLQLACISLMQTRSQASERKLANCWYKKASIKIRPSRFSLRIIVIRSLEVSIRIAYTPRDNNDRIIIAVLCQRAITWFPPAHACHVYLSSRSSRNIYSYWSCLKSAYNWGSPTIKNAGRGRHDEIDRRKRSWSMID
jgi:hypothetical protein